MNSPKKKKQWMAEWKTDHFKQPKNTSADGYIVNTHENTRWHFNGNTPNNIDV